MSSPYSDIIRRWAADDRRAGTLIDADGIGEVGLGKEEAGTRLAVRFALRMREGRAETVRYQVFGCGFTMAACAAAAELAEGRTLAEIAAVDPAWVDGVLGGLPEGRGYCAKVAVEALQAAVKCVGYGRQTVTFTMAPDDVQTSPITAADPVYRRLIDSPSPRGAPPEDRHLFACLVAVAAQESDDLAMVLGLSDDEFADLLHLYFPTISLTDLETLSTPASGLPPRINVEILNLLLAYLPHDDRGRTPAPSLWLARILAARAAHSGHLWHALGLTARPELTAAIRRHLPALAVANSMGMRWKRFLYKQLCEQGGGVMCKMPDCGVCSDYPLCFAVDQ